MSQSRKNNTKRGLVIEGVKRGQHLRVGRVSTQTLRDSTPKMHRFGAYKRTPTATPRPSSAHFPPISKNSLLFLSKSYLSSLLMNTTMVVFIMFLENTVWVHVNPDSAAVVRRFLIAA